MPLPQTRIKHVVVLMLENRSFDHLFGVFPPGVGQTVENLLGGSVGLSNRLDPEKPVSATNPEVFAGQPAPFAVHDKEGPSHSFNAVCVQLCNDKLGPSQAHPVRNNGFVRSYKDDLLPRTHTVALDKIAEVMRSFGPNQLPAITQLAREFCLCDHWFCEVPGPTMPNRMFIHAATSEGYVHNAFKREYTAKTVYGGFFDHVRPGPAPNPDGQNSPNPDDDAPFQVPAFSFDRMGLRVPALIVSPWVRKGTVENRTLQHTSVIRTATDLFGLAGPLNERDRSARSFADLFTQLPEPRGAADLPAALTRPPLTEVVSSTVAGVDVDPGDEPLDSLTSDWVQGFAQLVARRTGAALLGAVAAEPVPTTQGEAADFIDRHLKALGI